MTVIGVHELPAWFAERTDELLSNYRLDIQKQLDRIDEALVRTVETSDQLLEEVWGHDVTVTTRTIDTHVKRLREKLGDAGAMIETVRGIGYRFCE